MHHVKKLLLCKNNQIKPVISAMSSAYSFLCLLLTPFYRKLLAQEQVGM